MSVYTSQGTIRVHYDSDSKISLAFVPESDYSIKHGDDTFAVFVPLPSVAEAIIRKYAPDNEVDIDIDEASAACKEVMCSAAVHRVKVLVKVVPDPGGKLKFTGITVPAK